MPNEKRQIEVRARTDQQKDTVNLCQFAAWIFHQQQRDLDPNFKTFGGLFLALLQERSVFTHVHKLGSCEGISDMNCIRLEVCLSCLAGAGLQFRGVPEASCLLATVVGADGLLGLCLCQQTAPVGSRDLPQSSQDLFLPCYQDVCWGFVGLGQQCHALHAELCRQLRVCGGFIAHGLAIRRGKHTGQQYLEH